MKRIITLVIVLVMLLVSIGGCWPWWDREGGGRGGEHERGGGHEGHEEHR